MNSYDVLKEMLGDILIPEFYQVKYAFKKGPENFNIEENLLKTVMDSGGLEKIKTGQTVAISGSSRGVRHLDKILRVLVDMLKKHGAVPFVFPAMGSHGGATAEGQREVLNEYGISEETMGCPVKSSMEAVNLGDTKTGFPVYLDQYAAQADHIIPVGRIKPHTDFHGKVESGLMKMMTIGFGKQFGASLSHQRGWDKMAETVFEAGSFMVEHRSIPFGVGIVEDAFHELVLIEAIPGERIAEREQELLLFAKSLIPRIPFEKVDILLVDELGKNFSGAGMDPNVTGRSSVLGKSAPFIDIIGVFVLSEQSKHNATGVANADVITKRLFDDICFPDTFINVLTSHALKSGAIPMHMPDEKTVIQCAIEMLEGQFRNSEPRMLWIRNTVSLDCFYMSRALYSEALKNLHLRISRESRTPLFNSENNFAGWSGVFSF
jgi:hypothetical protein